MMCRVFLKTSVVLPPDSEIVAPFSVQTPSFNREIWRGGGTHAGGCFFMVGQCLDGKS